MKSTLRSLFLLALLVLAVPAGATTFQMVSDRSLAEQAAAVVEARVVGVEPAPVQGRPSTDYLVEVERVLKGDLPGSTVVVRVPGGVGPDGIGLKVWGAPEFAEGERALLFLNPAEDGTYRVLHLMLGAFHLRQFRGRPVALRDLSEAHEVGPWGVREGGVDVPRDQEAFSAWLEDFSYGVEREGDYEVDSLEGGELGVAPQPFGLLDSERGHNIRWFRFDQGDGVAWRVHSGGQPGLTLAATLEAFKTALAAWTDDPATNIEYSYAGTTGASGGLVDSDNVNTILFDDPYRDDPQGAVEGTFTCSKGGVIAIGGPYFYLSTRTFKGEQFHEAAEADIVTNNGTECFFRDNPKVAEEVFAHELGHTLGLGHSPNREALMYANASNDGRGARLAADDLAGISYLYGDGTEPVKPPVSGPQSLLVPARLRARAVSPTEVNLTWLDKSKGEDGYRVEVKAAGGRFQEVLALPADSASARVSGLKPGTAYVFRVRSAGSKGFSRYATVRLTTPKRR